jgi:hypothetical protein
VAKKKPSGAQRRRFVPVAGPKDVTQRIEIRRRKISDAPAPVGSLPPGNAPPQSKPNHEPKQQLEATPSIALEDHRRFNRAVRACEQIIEMASNPEIDEKRWDYEVQRWSNRWREAKYYARACKAKRYPEPERIDHQLRSLDSDWKIARTYRENYKGARVGSQIFKTPTPRSGPRCQLAIDHIESLIEQKKYTLQELQKMPKETLLGTVIHLGVKSRNTALKALRIVARRHSKNRV